MDRKRLLVGLQLIAGVTLAGLGHYFVSSQRAEYPLDGLVFYAAALIVFARLWIAAARESDPAWSALRDSTRAAWGVLRDAARVVLTAARDLIPLMGARALVSGIVGLNVLAVILSLLLPPNTWLWLIAWGGSAALLVIYVLPGPESIRRVGPAPSPRLARAAQVYVEPEAKVTLAPRAIWLALALALLIFGQAATGSVDKTYTPSASPSIADSLNASLQLQLTGDPAMVLAGALALIAGAIIFAVATRRSASADQPRLMIDAPARSGMRWGARWLLVAALAMLLWLEVLRSMVAEASGWGGVLPWLAAIVLIGACWWKIDRVRGVRHTISIDRREMLYLGLAGIAVLIICLFRLDSIPSSIWGDEGAFFSTASDIARGHFTADFFGLAVYGYPMAGSIFQGLWLGLFGVNIWAWRLGSVIPSVLAIFPLYFLARATLGRRVAWVSLALYATSPYMLTYARMGYNNSQSTLPVALTLALLWLAIRRDSLLYTFAAGLAGGLGFFTYTAGQLGFVLALGWLIWMWIGRVASLRVVARKFAAYALGILLIASPGFVYGTARYPDIYSYKHAESFFANSFYGRTIFSEQALYAQAGPIKIYDQEWFFAPDLYVTLLERGLVRTALGFHTPTLVNENYLVGALADPMGFIYLLGLGWCLARLRRPGYAIWPAWLLVGALALSVISTFPPRAAHMLPVASALAVLGALGLVVVVDMAATIAGRISQPMRSVALAGLTAALGFAGLRMYFGEVPARFPPNLVNVMIWQVQQLPRGSDIMLLQSPDYPDDFQLWGLRELDRGVTFHLLKPEALDSTDLRSLCPSVCRFFFEASARDQMLPRLTQAFGNGSLTEYPDADGNVQSYAFAP